MISSCYLGCRALACVCLEEIHLNNENLPIFLLDFSEEHEVTWHKIWLANLGQLPHLCPLPNLFHTQPTSLWAGWGLEGQPWCCVSAAQHQLKHLYIIITILAIPTKYSMLWTTVRKGNSILDTVHKYVSASKASVFPATWLTVKTLWCSQVSEGLGICGWKSVLTKVRQ